MQRRAIGHEATGLCIFAAHGDCRESMVERMRCKLVAPSEEHGTGCDDKAAHAISKHLPEDFCDLRPVFKPINENIDAEFGCCGERFLHGQWR